MLLTLVVWQLAAGADPSACAADADCQVVTAKCCSCDVQRAVTAAELKAENDRCAKVECAKPNCEAIKPFDPAIAVCRSGKCQLQKIDACATDADCEATTWACCACPEQRAVTKARLKADESDCAIQKCDNSCDTPKKPVDRSLVAQCKSGKCTLGKPAQQPGRNECSTADDCQVWCCQEDLGAAPKGKKPRPGCKRCPNPQPAAECLEGRCQVAPRALGK